MSEMVRVTDDAPDVALLTLHLALAEGQKPDLEVVARAVLAFAASVRDVAYVTDPSLPLRIEFVSATEGSLRVRARLRALRAEHLTAKSLLRVSCAIALWFTGQVVGWELERARDWLQGNAGDKLTSQEIQEIATQVAAQLQHQTGRQHVERVYRELSRDPAITAVGVIAGASDVPFAPVTRDNFPSRAAPPSEVTLFEPIGLGRRVRDARTAVTLISPVLLPANNRAWRVKSEEGEFGVYVWDADFLDGIAEGRIDLRMRPNIRLDVDLRTTELHKDGVWTVEERRILRVHDVLAPMSQSDLPLDR